jgi:CRP-like cAMP-binding protein
MNPTIDLGEFLHSLPSLAEFRPQELAILERTMTVDRYPDGYEFVTEKKPNDKLFLVVEGKVIATSRRMKLHGRDVLDYLGPGDLFGQAALIDRGLPLATCRADGPVTVASLPASAFDLLFGANARIAYCFQRLVAQQLVHRVRASVKALDSLFAEGGAAE